MSATFRHMIFKSWTIIVQSLCECTYFEHVANIVHSRWSRIRDSPPYYSLIIFGELFRHNFGNNLYIFSDVNSGTFNDHFVIMSTVRTKIGLFRFCMPFVEKLEISIRLWCSSTWLPLRTFRRQAYVILWQWKDAILSHTHCSKKSI